MGFVRRNFSASWDESRFAFRLAPSLIRNNCLTKIPANNTRQIIERPELVSANAEVAGNDSRLTLIRRVVIPEVRVGRYAGFGDCGRLTGNPEVTINWV